MAHRERYGLVGYPLGHSFSKTYFEDKFAREDICGVSYDNFPLENIGQLPVLLAGIPELRGFNVTIPYKERVIPLLARLDPVAAEIGAVNCVVVDRGDSLVGYNTDAPAFREELLGLIGGERPAALVLGSGGASKAVCYVLRTLGIGYAVVSRTPAPGRLTYDAMDAETIARHRLIVNTTPLGMGGGDACPAISYDGIGSGHFLFDLTYNPPETAFLRLGGDRGARCVNGYGMLVRQAELSWDIWRG